ncbi:hypothetical protein SKAU_G00214720 [Synaphobranchus kaupii]|uniref:Uncharacterized protein n=1 Tax=Synaphobranchus kaupii TaxID=118154 RepID=A0A9Q1F9Q0_SYNKA|nr:hypothetical protein SKAU_G00214720 [Synaphobranchus kaupii]
MRVGGGESNTRVGMEPHRYAHVANGIDHNTSAPTAPRLHSCTAGVRTGNCAASGDGALACLARAFVQDSANSRLSSVSVCVVGRSNIYPSSAESFSQSLQTHLAKRTSRAAALPTGIPPCPRPLPFPVPRDDLRLLSSAATAVGRCETRS